MAKKQSRRSISLSLELYNKLRAYCLEHKVPMALLVERAIRAATGIELPTLDEMQLEARRRAYEARWPDRGWADADPPAPDPTPLGVEAEKARQRRHAAATVRPAVVVPVPVQRLRGERIHAAAFCAVCTEDIVGQVCQAPIGKGGALVAVCGSCTSTSAKPDGKLQRRAGFEPRWVRQ